MYDEQWTALEEWFPKCNPIFVEDSNGRIGFLQPTAMNILLRNLRIPGIDISHKCLGIVCRNFQELDKASGTRSDLRPDLVRAIKALSSYIANFGDHHLRAASLASIVVVGQNDTHSDTNDDFEMVTKSTKHLSIGDERGDWIVLK